MPGDKLNPARGDIVDRGTIALDNDIADRSTLLSGQRVDKCKAKYDPDTGTYTIKDRLEPAAVSETAGEFDLWATTVDFGSERLLFDQKKATLTAAGAACLEQQCPEILLAYAVQKENLERILI